MRHPIHDAILIAITDSKPRGFFEEVKNRDGFFQVLAGVDESVSQEALEREIFAIIERAVRQCPFSEPDRERFLRIIMQWL